MQPYKSFLFLSRGKKKTVKKQTYVMQVTQVSISFFFRFLSAFLVHSLRLGPFGDSVFLQPGLFSKLRAKKTVSTYMTLCICLDWLSVFYVIRPI